MDDLANQSLIPGPIGTIEQLRPARWELITLAFSCPFGMIELRWTSDAFICLGDFSIGIPP